MARIPVKAERHTQLTSWSLPLRALPLFAFTACGPSSENDRLVASVSVRDSAGIEIVEAPREIIEALPEWSLQVELDLGGVDADAEHEFFRVNDVRVLDDGTLVVVNSGTQEIFFYDPQGRLQDVVGGDGEGPEEFRFPGRLEALPGDSLLVFDSRLRRLSVISPERRVSRSARLEGSVLNVNLEGVLDNGQVVVGNLVLIFPESAVPQTSDIELLLFDVDGALVRKVGDFPAQRFVLRGERGIASPVFDAITTFAVTGTGIWVGTGREYEVRMVDEDGETTRIIRWWGPDRTVTAADRERWADERMSRAETPEERDRAQETVSQAVFAERRAAYIGLGKARNGDLWIKDYQQWRSDSVRWLVLDSSGYPKAYVRTPWELTVFDVLGDRLVATIRDDFDIEHVVVYRLVKE